MNIKQCGPLVYEVLENEDLGADLERQLQTGITSE